MVYIPIQYVVIQLNKQGNILYVQINFFFFFFYIILESILCNSLSQHLYFKDETVWFVTNVYIFMVYCVYQEETKRIPSGIMNFRLSIRDFFQGDEKSAMFAGFIYIYIFFKIDPNRVKVTARSNI